LKFTHYNAEDTCQDFAMLCCIGQTGRHLKLNVRLHRRKGKTLTHSDARMAL